MEYLRRLVAKSQRALINNPFLISKAFSLNRYRKINSINNKIFFEIINLSDYAYFESIIEHLKNYGLFFYINPIKFNNKYVIKPKQLKKLLSARFGINKFYIVDKFDLRFIRDKYLCLTSDYFDSDISNYFERSVVLFHGLVNKNNQFSEGLKSFNFIFLTGERCLDNYNRLFLNKFNFKHQLFYIGYPKVDRLLNSAYDRKSIIEEYGLDPQKKTIIYAPTFGKGSSLNESGAEIIEVLATLNMNVLVVLHRSSFYKQLKHFNSDIQWDKILSVIKSHRNVRFIEEYNSNPFMFVSDIMVSDASGVAFEFLLTGKPVVFIDVPKYFNDTTKEAYLTRKNDISFSYRSLYGYLAKDLKGLIEYIEIALREDDEKKKNRKCKLIKELLYNPGHAGTKAAEAISEIFGNIRWRDAQKGEKKWWENWFKEHQNDDAWLNTVLSYFNLKENEDFGKKTLVDIGSGPIGILTKLRAKERIAIEPLPIESIDKAIERIKAPGEKIPLPDETADCVFIYNVLQHVMSPEKVLEEGTRILKKGGTFYLLEQLNLPTDKLHPHSLKLEVFERWIAKNNFEIVKKTKEDDCYLDIPKSAPGSGYSILCLILKKEA